MPISKNWDQHVTCWPNSQKNINENSFQFLLSNTWRSHADLKKLRSTCDLLAQLQKIEVSMWSFCITCRLQKIEVDMWSFCITCRLQKIEVNMWSFCITCRLRIFVEVLLTLWQTATTTYDIRASRCVRCILSSGKFLLLSIYIFLHYWQFIY